MLIWIIIFLVIIVVCGPIIDEQKKEKIEQEKRAEQQRLEDYKKEAERQRAEREAQERRLREQQRRAEQEANRIKIEAFIKNQTDSFADELEAIPKEEIELAAKSDFLNNNFVRDMDEIKISSPRNGSKKSLYGNFVVIDTETTGLKVTNDIIEVSAIRYFEFEPIASFTTLVKPSKEIPEEATEINGITDEMVADAPTIKQVMPALIDFIGKSNLLGYNITFDLKFLYKYGYDFFAQKNRKYYDCMTIARKKLDLYNYKLTTVCDYYDIYRTDAHRSLSDCYATAKVFIELLEEYDLLEDE